MDAAGKDPPDHPGRRGIVTNELSRYLGAHVLFRVWRKTCITANRFCVLLKHRLRQEQGLQHVTDFKVF